MQISQEEERIYEQNRSKMAELNKHFQQYRLGMIALGVVLFLTAFSAGAASTIYDEQKGANIFYYAMSTGVIQILLGIGSVVFGLIASGRKHAAILVLLGIYGLCTLAIVLRINGTMPSWNILFLLAGIFLNIWGHFLCAQDEVLQQQPGYPHFSPQAAMSAQYEAPIYVTARRKQQSDEMEGISNPAPAAPTPPPQLEAVPQLSELYANRKPGEAPPKLGPISLTTQQVNYQPPVQRENLQLEAFSAAEKPVQTAPPPQPAAQPDEKLEQIAETTHLHYYQPDQESLPSAEEVRARLQKMKEERDNKLSPTD